MKQSKWIKKKMENMFTLNDIPGPKILKNNKKIYELGW